ncbi:MAG TPA: hypothetical protein VIQ30_18080 [Pseudonocardia sp.]
MARIPANEPGDSVRRRRVSDARPAALRGKIAKCGLGRLNQFLADLQIAGTPEEVAEQTIARSKLVKLSNQPIVAGGTGGDSLANLR